MKKKKLFIVAILTACCAFGAAAQSANSIKKDNMKQLTPYKIDVAQTVLEDLNARLKQTR